MTTAHIHAALMAEYAKDAAETDKPWERWERKPIGQIMWERMYGQPTWSEKSEYRRRHVALCQVEGKDVFPGDKLWWKVGGHWITVVRYSYDTKRGLALWDHETWYALNNLSWNEPARTKTVYQWAFEQNDGRFCATSYFYATEAEARGGYGDAHRKVRRLDWTALEVPA